ncbi:MAG: Holliday junction branch migration protein RuvA [Treponema sp.]
MFNSIRGILTGKGSSSAFIDTYGIEWDVFATQFTLEKLDVGDEVKLYTWLQHREDQMQFFGFYSIKERSMFLDLTKVEGIGPKQAMKILSSITPDNLEVALENGDIARLQSISGIGKKTAQKMTLALKGKLTITDEFPASLSVKTEYEEIVRALVEMGYERKRCIEVVNKVASSIKEQDKDPLKEETELFRRSIVELA